MQAPFLPLCPRSGENILEYSIFFFYLHLHSKDLDTIIMHCLLVPCLLQSALSPCIWQKQGSNRYLSLCIEGANKTVLPVSSLSFPALLLFDWLHETHHPRSVLDVQATFFIPLVME